MILHVGHGKAEISRNRLKNYIQTKIKDDPWKSTGKSFQTGLYDSVAGTGHEIEAHTVQFFAVAIPMVQVIANLCGNKIDRIKTVSQ